MFRRKQTWAASLLCLALAVIPVSAQKDAAPKRAAASGGNDQAPLTSPRPTIRTT